MTEQEKLSETIGRYAEILSLSMKKWTDEERMKLISHLRSDFCFHCGRDLDEVVGGTCQCWNDD